MTEEELYNRYHEIRSTYVEVRFVDGESLIGKLDSFVSGANNEPDWIILKHSGFFRLSFIDYTHKNFQHIMNM